MTGMYLLANKCHSSWAVPIPFTQMKSAQIGAFLVERLRLALIDEYPRWTKSFQLLVTMGQGLS